MRNVKHVKHEKEIRKTCYVLHETHATPETHMKHEKREKSYDKKTYFCNIYSLDFIRLVFKEKYLQKNVPQSV